MTAFSDLIPNQGETVFQYVKRVGSIDKAWRTWNDFAADYLSRSAFRHYFHSRSRANAARFF